jgi:hypothetical protein
VPEGAIAVVGFEQAVGEFVDDLCGQRAQVVQVVLDQVVPGHGRPSINADITVENSRQPSRCPARARRPAAVRL